MPYRDLKETGRDKRDVAIIVITSLIFAGLYIAYEQPIMEYGRNPEHALLWRFLPVAVIQYGMAGLGISIVLCKNRESLRQHGLVMKNLLWSAAGCLAVSVPTILFLYFTGDIHGFLPFQGMFLTEDILYAAFPCNIIGSPSQLDVASVAAHGPPRGSNSEHAPVHRPRVSVSVSGVAPDAHYRDVVVACAGLAGGHDQEEDTAVLLQD